jgi:hypothetical protein
MAHPLNPKTRGQLSPRSADAPRLAAADREAMPAAEVHAHYFQAY